MKLIDANILVYVVHRRAAEHTRLRRWWEAALAAEEPIGLTWIALLAFVRLTTRPGVFQKPLSVSDAIAHVDEWLAQPNVRLVLESDDHWKQLRNLILRVGTAGNLTTDAHLAAIAIANAATLVSCDADFGRFRQIRWENPLSQSGN
jgi:toxin-antitoxin system PIN domain toxin